MRKRTKNDKRQKKRKENPRTTTNKTEACLEVVGENCLLFKRRNE